MESTFAHAVTDAVMRRFLFIRDSLVERDGDYIYGGSRTLPENLGWRFRQNMSLKLKEPGGAAWQGYPELPAEILAGNHDGLIEYTWHDAASAEHWYKNEKDYGTPDNYQYRKGEMR